MSGLFLTVLNMSITASCLIGAVLILRLLLKKAPRWASVLLWGIAALRLVLPFSMESGVSLVPHTQWIERQPDDITEIPDEVFLTPDMITDTELGENVTVIHHDNTVQLEIREKPDFIGIFTYIWLGGGALLLLYAAVTAIRLHRKISSAVLLRDNIYQSEHIPTPFVLGIIKPRIYIPFSLDESALSHVIAHEKAHIRRWDHIWKPLGFFILAVHWFNPLVWVGYILLCRDIEGACDEKVIKSLDDVERADYSQALLNCSTGRRMIAACPLAFGEVSVKERVKGVLSYKKPALWIILAAVIACAVFAVCFLTDPVVPDEENWKPLDTLIENYTAEEAAEDGCVVIDGMKLLAGEKIWNEFVSKTKEMQPAAVRIYRCYSEAFQHSSQKGFYVVMELRYDGSVFRLTHYDWEGITGELFLSESEYKYMVRSPLDILGNLYDTYLLADSTEVTAAGYESSLVSSVHRPEYDIYNNCRMIYRVLTGESETTYREPEAIMPPYFTSGFVTSELSFDAPPTVLDFVAKMANNLNAVAQGYSVTEAVLTELEALPIDMTHFPEAVDFYRIGFKLIGTSVDTDDVVVFTEKDMESSYLLVYHSFDNSTEGHSMLIIADRMMEENYNTEEMLEHYGNKYTAAAVCVLRRMYPHLFPDPIP